MKVQKRPVTVEAWQWRFTEDQERSPIWMDDALSKWPDPGGASFEPDHDDGPRICIATLEGVMVAQPNDWIIRGVKGELYPCKPDIFRATYVPLDDDDDPLEWCEACGKPAATADTEGTPLCDEDFEALLAESPRA